MSVAQTWQFLFLSLAVIKTQGKKMASDWGHWHGGWEAQWKFSLPLAHVSQGVSPGSDSQSAPPALWSLLHILCFRSLPCSFSLFRHTDNPDFPSVQCALMFPFPVGYMVAAWAVESTGFSSSSDWDWVRCIRALLRLMSMKSTRKRSRIGQGKPQVVT